MNNKETIKKKTYIAPISTVFLMEPLMESAIITGSLGRINNKGVVTDSKLNYFQEEDFE
ncbi:hypothetical protein [Prevotella sp.]